MYMQVTAISQQTICAHTCYAHNQMWHTVKDSIQSAMLHVQYRYMI